MNLGRRPQDARTVIVNKQSLCVPNREQNMGNSNTVLPGM